MLYSSTEGGSTIGLSSPGIDGSAESLEVSVSCNTAIGSCFVGIQQSVVVVPNQNYLFSMSIELDLPLVTESCYVYIQVDGTAVIFGNAMTNYGAPTTVSGVFSSTDANPTLSVLVICDIPAAGGTLTMYADNITAGLV
jgi:hypothetical protein